MNKANTTVRYSSARVSGGRLYVVGTPIGNLEDITLRALNTLKAVDLIACEDTRRTQKLLNHYDLRTPTISYHEHNEMTRAPELVLEMEQGSEIALVSDAGTPVLSDPGFRLVHLAIRHKVPVIPIPGPSALVTALTAAGLPMSKFIFAGFLPVKRSARRKALASLAGFEETIIIYEAPHRIIDSLGDIRKMVGEREVVIAREVTKLYEEFIRGSITEICDRLKKKPVRGELTVIVGPGPAPRNGAANGNSVQAEVDRLKASEGLDERSALKVIARSRGISRSELYRQLQLERREEKQLY